MNCEGLEGIARDLLEDTCTEAPVSALTLAAAAGFRIAPWQGQGALVDRAGKTIYLSPFVTRVERQHELVAHELGHVLLWEHGLPDSEAGATFLAGALLVPRASLALIARRITQVRPAVATVAGRRPGFTATSRRCGRGSASSLPRRSREQARCSAMGQRSPRRSPRRARCLLRDRVPRVLARGEVLLQRARPALIVALYARDRATEKDLLERHPVELCELSRGVGA